MHTLENSLPLVRAMEQVLAPLGYHVALGGSVLIKGESTKDVDVFIYPHQVTQTKPHGELLAALSAAGLRPAYDEAASTDDKEVWVCRAEQGRVDLFFLGETTATSAPAKADATADVPF